MRHKSSDVLLSRAIKLQLYLVDYTLLHLPDKSGTLHIRADLLPQLKRLPPLPAQAKPA